MEIKEFPWQPTWLAFLRIFSDIAYATEIATEANFEDIQQAPRFEQRYKSVTNLIRQRGAKHILELAAGFSSRGLFMTQDPSIRYVESDKARVISQKKQVVTKLLEKVGAVRPNLMFAEVDAFKYAHLLTGVADLNGPISVVSEGLFSYFTPQKQHRLARNIHRLLSETGGVWITPDITTRGEWARSYGRKLSSRYGERTYLFKDEKEIDMFFAETRFQAEKFSQSVLAGELVSIERLRLDRSVMTRRLSDMRIYCLSPR